MKKRPFPIRAPLLGVLLLSSGLAQADVYKCVDAEGGITYTNQKNAARGCKLLSQDQPVTAVAAPTSRPSGSPAASASANPSPGNFPKVAPETQKSRDSLRRRTLEQELAAEQHNLETAQKQLAEQEATRNGNERNYEKVLERVQPYKDRVADHQRNIEALNKEIANLK